MSSKWELKTVCTSIILIFIVNVYAKDISRVEREHKRLNEYISHYETLNYDHEHIKDCHKRAKRSVTNNHFVHIQFSAHGRDFHLRLKRDLITFSDKLQIYGSAGPVDVSMDHIYVGKLIGDRNSYVFGSLLDGVFEGKIITERDAYYVEHAKRYFPTNRTEPNALLRAAENKKQATTKTTTEEYHSVIYKDSHVEDAYKDVREGHVGGCGITQEVSHWMETIQNSTVKELTEPLSKNVNDHDQNLHKTRATSSSRMAQYESITLHGEDRDNASDQVGSSYNSNNNRHEELASALSTRHLTKQKKHASGKNGSNNYQKYMNETNLHYNLSQASGVNGNVGSFFDPESGYRYSPNDANWHQRVHERVRRASGSGAHEDNKNTCSLYIQTDPLIWRHIREGIINNDGAHKYEIDAKTREEITSLIAQHVTAVNYIYSNTKFEGHMAHRKIRFEVQRIKIDDDSVCRSAYDDGPRNAFCNEHMDVSNFLNLHSLEDHSDFCLAYVFTYRDFTGGTLGLAWVANPRSASGGICEKYKTYTEDVDGQFQNTRRSLNTGVITFVNYNSRVPPKVSQLTLAHEIGHNFGSPHDYPGQCRPGGLKGNYIMFASATSGDRPNNSKFSPCSIRNISDVLDLIVGIEKRECFTASEGAFCGNKIVEPGEECDCGFNKEECNDICCFPRLISEYEMLLNSSAEGCTRRAKTQCSPSQGPCCLANSCTFVPANYLQKCKEEAECSWASTCDGTSAECPEPQPRDDKTMCNHGTSLCIRGDCAGSICLLWNMSECFLTSQAVPHEDKRKLCELACQNGNDTSTCRSTSEFADLYGLPVGGISLRPGSPCDNFQGYCDVFLKCRAVDADGPLVRLKKLLLNRETLLTIAQWITENWYIVVLMSIGFIVVMGVFLKCCAVHTPSSNPKMRRARRISETLRAPMNTLRRMRSPHGHAAAPRSIPPPVHNPRSHNRSQPFELSHRHDQNHLHPTAAPLGGQSVVILPPLGGRASRSGGGRQPKIGRSERQKTVSSEESDCHRSSSQTRQKHVKTSHPGLSAGAARAQMPLPTLPTQQKGFRRQQRIIRQQNTINTTYQTSYF